MRVRSAQVSSVGGGVERSRTPAERHQAGGGAAAWRRGTARAVAHFYPRHPPTGRGLRRAEGAQNPACNGAKQTAGAIGIGRAVEQELSTCRS